MSWAVPSAPGIQPVPYYSQPMNTAYTPVSIRQGFGQTFQSQQQYSYTAPANPPQSSNTMSPPSDQQQQKFDWPQSVRNYVQRTFQASNEIPGVSSDEKQARLKEIIRSEQEKGTMLTTNWDEMPLPQQIIHKERQQALMTIVDPATTQAHTPTFAANSKKRKSSDFSESEQTNGSTVPWRSTKALSLEDRVSKPASDKRLLMDGPLTGKSKFQKYVDKRQRRGDGGYQSSYRSPSPPPPSGPIVGLNKSLEKRYFRLTAAPKPEDVRPEHVLQQTLDLLKKKWRKENNYNYICDQFKSLRQDLTVQHVRNEFTVSVYEIHARIALEKGDLGEYNQCQTQLRALYRAGIKGNAIEFKAYRILYFIHTANRTALNDAIADLTSAEKEERPVKHALSVRSALALGNYHKFFQLYLDVPNMGAYLMDMFIKRERLAALANMCKAFKPEVKLRYITEELAFESDAEAAQFIIDYDQELLQERGDHIVCLTGKAGQTFENARTQAFSRVDLKGQI
ncbi:SAC3/GANP/Nin1/mts3/eIF-3 p25 family-domain-containing protein [Xylariaceae sp. AK1471]|nr:SAC3/GANP/Nin1/mts3/eIF-3 p25 family-domain-containing protein [Xylariaceae sp. AK1471]